MTRQHPAAPEGEHRPNGCCDFHRHIADGCCHCDATAAPETETDASGRLTDAEWDDLRSENLDDLGPELRAAVERIVAERLRVVEGERDAWKSRRDAAVEQCRHLHQDGKTREQWHLDNCGAMHMVRAIEKVADDWGYICDDVEYPTRYDMWRQLRDTLSTRTFDRDPQRARAESAEAAHEALRAGIWALGESIHGDEGEPTCFACILADLRALLAGGGAR